MILRVFFRTILVLGLGAAAAPAALAEVNIYSERQPFLIDPLLKAFTEETGIETNAVYLRQGMLERLEAEGEYSPADMILTTNIGNLNDHVEAGLLQGVESETINQHIPAQYRDPKGRWFALTRRARVVYAHKERVKPGEIETYADLAASHMEGRVCTRSGKHPYNINLLAAIIAAKGEDAAEEWARGLKANLARRPQGNDRAQIKAIYDGVCDVAVGNTYYLGYMLTNENQPEQQKWAESVRIVFPTLVNGEGEKLGTHINISGAGVTQAAQNKEDAIRLIEFLSGETAQKLYARENFEYLVNPEVDPHPVVQEWGTFTADPTPLTEIAQHIDAATRIMDRIGFDF